MKTFMVPPHIGPVKFRDDLADESFRVYEHPKVDVFLKETTLSSDQLLPLILHPSPDIEAMTYEEVLTALPPTHVGPKIQYPVFRWLISLELIGWIVFPSVFLIFRRFHHKGFPLAKGIGLLVTAYIAWLIPSLRILEFDRSLILFVLTLFLLGKYINISEISL